jgi:hypothetical protein
VWCHQYFSPRPPPAGSADPLTLVLPFTGSFFPSPSSARPRLRALRAVPAFELATPHAVFLSKDLSEKNLT